MSITTPPAQFTDAELVGRSLRGDRDAYTLIVQRYQSLICAVTYAACGDVHKSEDLAQETFLAGWKSLADLKDASLLRSWLRGIARNVANNAVRKEAKAPESAQPPDQALPSDEPTPADEAISHEEQALLWQNLAKLPDRYREPLVLFYREQQSVAAVAEALDLSEDATRQRLSRGRAMLAARIEKLIDRGLRESAPSRAFTLGVVAALPTIATQHVVATTAASAAVKSGASTKAAATIGGIAGAIFGPIAGLSTMFLSYRMGISQSIAGEERRLVRRLWIRTLVMAGVLNIFIFGAIELANWLNWSPRTLTLLLVGVCAVFCATLMISSLRFNQALKEIRVRLVADPSMTDAARQSARLWHIEYRTKLKLLGLPLIHVQIGAPPEMECKTVKAWVAFGMYAYSPLLAVGVIAIAPLSWGVTAIGVLSWGVISLGWWSLGVFAMGFEAVGVCAVAWHAASGVVALAHGYAEGVSAFAHQVNNARAARAINSDWLFRSWGRIGEHTDWLWVVMVVPMIAMMRRAAKLRRAESASK